MLDVNNYFNPLPTSAAYTYATQCQNLDFNLKRDHQKNSSERRENESVDENGLS